MCQCRVSRGCNPWARTHSRNVRTIVRTVSPKSDLGSLTSLTLGMYRSRLKDFGLEALGQADAVGSNMLGRVLQSQRLPHSKCRVSGLLKELTIREVLGDRFAKVL